MVISPHWCEDDLGLISSFTANPLQGEVEQLFRELLNWVGPHWLTYEFKTLVQHSSWTHQKAPRGILARIFNEARRGKCFIGSTWHPPLSFLIWDKYILWYGLKTSLPCCKQYGTMVKLGTVSLGLLKCQGSRQNLELSMGNEFLKLLGISLPFIFCDNSRLTLGLILVELNC